ncbi:MAG: hypothetical protein IPP71_20800 [Bacteroidetes bacterium]|nr:hypothetical protein [Bacteroidota bacterium]
MLRRLLFILLLWLPGYQVDATHIVGGELYYTYLGTNTSGVPQYRIRLTVYRDCFNGVPPFDDPAFVGIWDANNVLITNLNLTPNDSATIPPIINSPCFVPPTNVCYRVCNYYANVNLPIRPGGYQLAYQRCCRNQTILNVIDPLTVGGTFYCTIPGSPAQNSNPVFTQPLHLSFVPDLILYLIILPPMPKGIHWFMKFVRRLMVRHKAYR